MAESFHIDADLTGSGDNFDNQGLNIGFTFVPAVDGQVTGIRFRSTGTVSGTYMGALYSPVDDDPPNGSTNGTSLGAVTFGSVTATAWNVASFASAINVTAGQPYRARLHNTAGRYVARGGGFFGSAITRGNLTAIADGSTHATFILRNGTYLYDTNPTYPKDSNGACFFVDVVFEPAGGTTPVSSDLDLRWAVKTIVNSDVDLRWSVKNAVSSDVDLRWRVAQRVSSDADLRWAVKNQVSSDLDLRWRNRITVNSDLDLRWRLGSTVTSDLDLRWVVDSSLAVVNSDLDLRWRVRQQVTSDLALAWLVRQQVASDLDVRWRVFNVVSADHDFRWRVFNAVSTDLDLRWRVLLIVITDLNLRWIVVSDVVYESDLVADFSPALILADFTPITVAAEF